jgi:RNA polymerase sigma-70 factor (ECF subfamily)
MADAPQPPPAAPLPALVRASQEGDRAALGELLRRYLPGVRAFVRLRMGPELRARESGSDVVQSVCADLLTARDVVIDDEVKFRNWLYVAALNKLRSHGRTLHAQKRDPGREAALPSGDDVAACYASVLSPSGQLIANERIAQLEAAFDQLPEHYREVVTLARIAGLTYAQIAAATGRTEDAVRNILARALNKLAALLEDAST